MNAQVLKGSSEKHQKAWPGSPGEVREAIVFIEEPSDVTEDSPQEYSPRWNRLRHMPAAQTIRVRHCTAAWTTNDPLGHRGLVHA